MVHLNDKNWGKVYEIIGSFEVVIGEKREGIPDGKNDKRAILPIQTK